MANKYSASLVASLSLFAMVYSQHTFAVAAPKELRLVCSVQKDWCDLLAQKYGAEFGVKVEMKQMATNAALEAIRTSSEMTQFDVWFGGTGDPHLEAANENLTVAYRSSQLSNLHDWATWQASLSNYKTVGVYSGVLGFIVNEDSLRNSNLKPPRCWLNLLRPEYAGAVLSSNPASSGTAYTVMATWISMMGEDQAFKFMKQLNSSIKEYAKSGGGLASRIAKGESPIAIGFIHDGVSEKQKGAPIAVITPCEGSGYETGSVSIIKGGRVSQAKHFVDWVLLPKTQELAAAANQFQVPSHTKTPIPSGTPRFNEFKIYMAYDPKRFSNPEEKKRLIARWEKDVFQEWQVKR